MKNNKSLIDVNDKKSIIEFLQAPAIKMAEVITGILVSDSTELKLSAGKLIQASIKFKLLSQLGKELREYAEKGKIKDDILGSSKSQASLCELLKFIDDDVPDEERFKAMKSIFLFSITTDTTEKDKELAFELLRICKKISSSELLILKACYEISNGNHKFEHLTKERVLQMHSAGEWLGLVSQQIGHNIPSLIQVYEESLENLKLISHRQHPDRSGIYKTQYFRLTELGYKLCEFITKYQ
ncbi:MAG: hypothetical protein KKH29_02845 [Candidatus Omnitrophica bacterium]|nr:hypothetical protein [Candidatus Omnitrophota bacterium]